MRTIENRAFNLIPLGIEVRGQLNREYIYRVRHGNGVNGSILGARYQDRYAYIIPSSINNPEGQPARDALTSAVFNWKNVLSTTEKAQYRERANKGLNMSGYNLYIKEFIEANT